MKHIIFSVMLVFILSGCTKLQYMDELLTLKSVADDQTAMAKMVDAQNKKFEALLEAVRNDRIRKYDTEKSVRRAFGEPILIRQREHNQQQLSEWLYRYATKFFNSDKVYLYFDESKRLVDWKYIEGKQPEVKEVSSVK